MIYELIGHLNEQTVRIPLVQGLNPINRGVLLEHGYQSSLVSRSHAEIDVTGNSISIRDLGSRNGTLVNGQPAKRWRRLQDGDRIAVGDVDLLLRTIKEDPSDEPALASWLSGADEVSATSVIDLREAQAADRPERMQTISKAGELLVRADPLEETIAAFMDLIESEIDARRILLLLENTDAAAHPRDDPESKSRIPGVDSLTLKASRPGIPSDETLVLSHTLVEMVLGDRQALLVEDLLSHEALSRQESIVAMNLRSAMVAPLFDNRRVIGLLYADSTEPGRPFDRERLGFFTLLANLLAVKITNTRLQEIERERERMAQQLEVAAMLQRRLLPEQLPTIQDYDLFAVQIPCFEVAGDLYDITTLADGRLVLVLGDVTGKGIGAALLMTNVMATLRALYRQPVDLRLWMTQIHEQVLASSDALHSVTLFLGLLDPLGGRLDYASAGHDPALLIPPEGSSRELMATGVPAGMLSGMTYETSTVEIPHGSTLVIYSDGIREAQADEEDPDSMFGLDRLQRGIQLRQDQSLSQIADSVLEDLRAHVGTIGLDDDVTLLLLRRK